MSPCLCTDLTPFSLGAEGNHKERALFCGPPFLYGTIALHRELSMLVKIRVLYKKVLIHTFSGSGDNHICIRTDPLCFCVLGIRGRL